MNRITNTMKLDFYTAKSTLVISAVTYVISALVGLSTKQTVISMALVMVFGTYTCGSVFSVEEKNHIDKLHGILPLRKSDMIAGRYVYALVIGLVNLVIAGIFGFVISLIVNAGLSAMTFFSALGLTFLYFCFAVAIAFPVYFKFTFTKAYVFTMIPIYLVMLLVVFLSRRSSVFSGAGQLFQVLSNAPAVILLLGLVLGLAFLAVSAYIANRIYRKKEIY